MKRRSHTVNILLPLALLLMFVISALAVLLFATRIYWNITEQSARNGETRSALSYVSEKIHSGDGTGCVRLETIEGTDVLVLTQTHGEETFATYVYFLSGELKELFVKAGAEVPLSAGRNILELEDFSVTAAGENLLKITCTDFSGNTAAAFVALRSEGGVQP